MSKGKQTQLIQNFQYKQVQIKRNALYLGTTVAGYVLDIIILLYILLL
jgi:hypothetical protein